MYDPEIKTQNVERYSYWIYRTIARVCLHI